VSVLVSTLILDSGVDIDGERSHSVHRIGDVLRAEAAREDDREGTECNSYSPTDRPVVGLACSAETIRCSRIEMHGMAHARDAPGVAHCLFPRDMHGTRDPAPGTR
jgi:hypothetical protein